MLAVSQTPRTSRAVLIAGSQNPPGAILTAKSLTETEEPKSTYNATGLWLKTVNPLRSLASSNVLEVVDAPIERRKTSVAD
ncbi:MAG: hypothetical protein LH702_01215 [Phormidesmis sp. CAN_BIN44]|nr:hypothetical protein [Phormidesmis sp. CAN_BIN44]